MDLINLFIILASSALLGAYLGERRGRSMTGGLLGLILPLIGLIVIPFLSDGDEEPMTTKDDPRERLKNMVSFHGLLAGAVAFRILDYYGQTDTAMWVALVVLLGVCFISGVTVVAFNWREFFPTWQSSADNRVQYTNKPELPDPEAN